MILCLANDLAEQLPTVSGTDGCAPNVDDDSDMTPSMHKVSVQEVAPTLAAIKLTLVNKINGSELISPSSLPHLTGVQSMQDR